MGKNMKVNTLAELRLVAWIMPVPNSLRRGHPFNSPDKVDMVFEVRDARIPFTSANDDLDKIVGPSKARLIVLNKVGS